MRRFKISLRKRQRSTRMNIQDLNDLENVKEHILINQKNMHVNIGEL